jgi:diadenosine tetraphosphate (Ap4A) HIT family hydrolase
MPPLKSVFCALPPDRISDSTEFSLLIHDAYPVSPGHSLLIPRRHVPSFFDLSNSERNDLFDLLDRARTKLLAELQPDAFNIGINDGPAAGQTLMHLHVHLIPRFNGDHRDPRGGIRWIFPDKADYWSGRG